MKASDICVGDWVNYKSQSSGKLSPIKIENIYGVEFNCEVEYWNIKSGYSISDTEPIELTEDILVKNGFSEIHHPGTGATDEYSEWFLGGIKITEWLEDWKDHHFSTGGDDCSISFNYVHELQHLLRLVGVQKEITL